MITHPKCIDCGHSKSKHGTIQLSQYVGYRKRRKIVDVPSCHDCWNFLVYGPTYEWEYDIDVTKIQVENKHTYRPNNLGYLERKYEKFHRLHKEA